MVGVWEPHSSSHFSWAPASTLVTHLFWVGSDDHVVLIRVHFYDPSVSRPKCSTSRLRDAKYTFFACGSVVRDRRVCAVAAWSKAPGTCRSLRSVELTCASLVLATRARGAAFAFASMVSTGHGYRITMIGHPRTMHSPG